MHLQTAADPRTGSTGGQGAPAEGGQPQNWQHKGSGYKNRGRPTPELAAQGVRVQKQRAANPRTGSTGGQGTKTEGGQPQNWQHRGSGCTCRGRPTPELAAQGVRVHLQRAANPRTGSIGGQGAKAEGGQPQNWHHKGLGCTCRRRPTPELAARWLRVQKQRAANPRNGSTGGQGTKREGGQPQNWQRRGSGCTRRGRPTQELAAQGVRVHLQRAANPRTGSTGGQGAKAEGGQPQNWQHRGSGYTLQRAANPRTGNTGGQDALAEGGRPQNWQHGGSGCTCRGRPTPELAA